MDNWKRYARDCAKRIVNDSAQHIAEAFAQGETLLAEADWCDDLPDYTRNAPDCYAWAEICGIMTCFVYEIDDRDLRGLPIYHAVSKLAAYHLQQGILEEIYTLLREAYDAYTESAIFSAPDGYDKVSRIAELIRRRYRPRRPAPWSDYPTLTHER